MRSSILIALISLSPSSFSQDAIWLYNSDSIELVVYDNVSKEMTIEGEEEYSKEIGRTNLNPDEIEGFKKTFNSFKNYDERSGLRLLITILFSSCIVVQ